MNRVLVLPIVLVAWALVGSTGCATILRSTKQEVAVTSDPAQANVLLDGRSVGITPAVIELERGKTHALELQKVGYDRSTSAVKGSIGAAWIVLDVLFGLIPVAVDALTGRWKTFDDEIYVKLAPRSSESIALASASPDSLVSVEHGVTGGFHWLVEDIPLDVLGDSTAIIVRFRKSGWNTEEMSFEFLKGMLGSHRQKGPYDDQALTIQGTGGSIYLLGRLPQVVQLTILEIRNQQVRVKWKRL